MDNFGKDSEPFGAPTVVVVAAGSAHDERAEGRQRVVHGADRRAVPRLEGRLMAPTMVMDGNGWIGIPEE